MYNIEIDRIIDEIRKTGAKLICLQLPDGMKPQAADIQKAIETATKAQVLIWGGTCFGSCDLPLEVKNLGVDLLIHFGHAPWQDAGKRDYGKIL
jgi:2-(3-amino-3-carboxypropyl)histidine synthase